MIPSVFQNVKMLKRPIHKAIDNTVIDKRETIESC